MGAGLRLGTVPFLNAEPLTRELASLNGSISLTLGTPAELARALEAGALDGALVSSYAYFTGRGYRLVPGVGIVSRGRVESIRLYLKKPLPEVRSVALDAGSLSAAHLARLLLEGRWGLRPRCRPLEPGASGREVPEDAFLLIGDPALCERGEGLEAIDLGSEWGAWTGLPFVYALWVFREGGEGVVEAARSLLEAKRLGVAQLPEIAREGALRLGVGEALCRDYLLNCIHYDVGEEEVKGLLRYYDLLVEAGLAPPGRGLRFIEL
ncbi:MAG: menaquinone biosynthetic enzyme MqnA/MqnD family protein [Nitrospinota bacterium]